MRNPKSLLISPALIFPQNNFSRFSLQNWCHLGQKSHLPRKVSNLQFFNTYDLSRNIQIHLFNSRDANGIQNTNLNFLSKFLKLHNLKSQFRKLLRPQAPPFQKIEWNPLNLVTFRQCHLAFIKIEARLTTCKEFTVKKIYSMRKPFFSPIMYPLSYFIMHKSSTLFNV